MRRDLDGIPVQMEDLPQEIDLTSGDPPLSPSILGLFRGTPLGVPCEPEPGAQPGDPCRSIALYRKNLGRAVKTRAELVEQISVTLLHEIGHLRGEDDSELAARGLE
jgi:predicted Zn-dependent protease with MMP-like domain